MFVEGCRGRLGQDPDPPSASDWMQEPEPETARPVERLYSLDFCQPSGCIIFCWELSCGCALGGKSGLILE